MKNIKVNKDGNAAIAKIVRYIKLDGLKYIIYSLNEIDEEEYEKLYVNKLEDNNIIEIDEWVKFKKAIPMIVKSIKADAIDSFEDLSINDINDIDTTNYKAFKLKKDIVFSIVKEEDIIEDSTDDYGFEDEFDNTDKQEEIAEETIIESSDKVEDNTDDFEFKEVHPISNLEEETIKEYDHSKEVEDILGTLDEDIDDLNSDYEDEYNLTSDFKSESTIEKQHDIEEKIKKLEKELEEKENKINELEDKLNKIKDMLI